MPGHQSGRSSFYLYRPRHNLRVYLGELCDLFLVGQYLLFMLVIELVLCERLI